MAVDHRNTHFTDVMRDSNNAYVTAAVRMLLNQADARSRANCGNGESREVQAWCTPYLATGVIHSFPTPAAIGPPKLLTDTRALSNSSLMAVYLWLAIAKAVSQLDDWSCFMQPRCVVHTHTHHGCIKQLQSFEHRQEWRHVTNELLVSDFTAHFTGSPPLVFVYRFTSVSHDLQWGGLRLIRSSWVARRRRARRRLLSAQYWARLLRKVLGQYQYHPILASIDQYPIPQYWYRSIPNERQCQM